MGVFDQWNDNVDESVGDAIYDSLEQKAKDEAKELTKKGVDNLQETGKAAVEALDKATDHIAPVKTIKDKVKAKLSNNPFTHAKAAVKKAKEKAKKALKEGIQGVCKATVEGIKALGRLAASHPAITVVVILLLLALMIFVNNEEDSEDGDAENSSAESISNTSSNLQSDDVLLDSPVYVNVDGMSDDDVVVILMADCMDQQYDAMGELDADKEESAKFIYSIFRSDGFNNASIAGILANIDIESGLDPSAIEGIFSEYGFLGTKKAEALLSMSNYTENILFPKYVDSGVSINRDGYKATDNEGNTVYYCGMGLAQWTAGNALTLLNAAETLSMDWYNRDFQLAYMLSDCMYRPDFFANWVNDQAEGLTDDDYDDWYSDYTSGMTDEQILLLDPGTVSSDWESDKEESWIDAARESGAKFAHDYEGNTASDEDRKNAAEEWYNIIKDWDDTQVNNEFVDSIVALATDLGGIVEFVEIQNAQYRCLNGNVFDNSSLAAAAVSLAWPTREQSFNNGTNLYQVVHDGIFPTDYIYKACDRSMATAVRWSGTDDQYPVGNTNEQFRYLEASSKWEKVGSASSLSMDDLQPGDIFILNGHTFMFVGESAIQAAYMNEAKPGSDSVSGSLNDRSPGCDTSSSSIINRGGEDWENRGIYQVFRCIEPDNSSTYSSIGSGVTN